MNVDIFFSWAHLISRTKNASFLSYLIFLFATTLVQYLIFSLIRESRIFANLTKKTLDGPKFILIFLIAGWFFTQAALIPLMKPTLVLADMQHGSACVNYDYYAERGLKNGSIPTDPIGFMKKMPLGSDLARHPVSGPIYYFIWILTKDYMRVKIFYALFNLASAFLLYRFVKRIAPGSGPMISFLAAFFFIVNPMNFSSSHDWTDKMGRNQIGIFFILISLLIFIRYCATFKNRYFYGAFISYLAASLSYEPMTGFFIAYIFLYFYRDKFITIRPKSGMPRQLTFVKALSAAAAAALILIMAKAAGKWVLTAYNFDPALLTVSNDLSSFFSSWKSLITGNTIATFPEARGIAYYVMHFPFYFLAQHITRALYIFYMPQGLAVITSIVLAVINLTCLACFRSCSEDSRGGQAINFRWLISAGFILFLSAIIVPMTAIGQILAGYIYCGYFGLTLVYSAVFMRLSKIEYNKSLFKYNMVNLALLFLLNLFEFKNLGSVFFSSISIK